MAKTKVTVKFDFNLKKFFEKEMAEDISEAIIKGILESTAIGLSPVRGFGRFVGYKAQEEARKLKTIAKHFNNANKKAESSSARAESKSRSLGYPASVQGRFADKKVRPVNLRLTGSMLDSIGWKIIKSGLGVSIGIFKGKQKLMAETHNEGTQEPNVPTRQFLPTHPGQEFNVSIMRSIKEIYNNRLKSIIELSNKK